MKQIYAIHPAIFFTCVQNNRLTSYHEFIVVRVQGAICILSPLLQKSPTYKKEIRTLNYNAIDSRFYVYFYSGFYAIFTDMYTLSVRRNAYATLCV